MVSLTICHTGGEETLTEDLSSLFEGLFDSIKDYPTTKNRNTSSVVKLINDQVESSSTFIPGTFHLVLNGTWAEYQVKHILDIGMVKYCPIRNVRYMLLPSREEFLSYKKKKYHGARLKYALSRAVAEMYGDSFEDRPTQINLIETVSQFEKMLAEVGTPDYFFLDTETMPFQSGLKTDSEIKAHSVTFWKTRLRTFQFSVAPFSSYVIPALDPESAFDIGCNTELEYVESDNGLFYILKNNTPITRYNGEIILFSPDRVAAFQENKAYADLHNIGNLWREYAARSLQISFIGNTNVTKVIHNWTFDRNVLRIERNGAFDFKGGMHDTMQIWHSFDPDAKLGLEQGAKYRSELSEWDEGINYANSPLDQMAIYAAVDTDVLAAIFTAEYPKLISNPKLLRYYKSIKLPALVWFAETEFHGVPVSAVKFMDLIEKWKKELEECTNQILSIPHFLDYQRNKKEAVLAQCLHFWKIEFGEWLTSFRIDTLKKIAVAEKNISSSDPATQKKALRELPTLLDLIEWADSGASADHSKLPTAAKHLYKRRNLILSGAFENGYIKSVKETKKQLGGVYVKKGKTPDSFSVSSTQDVEDYLFYSKFGKKLPLIDTIRTKTENGKKVKVFDKTASASNDDLFWFEKDDETGWIKLYRRISGLNFLISAATEVLDCVDPNEYIHTRYKFVRTGRTSSSGPNMQNKPQRTDIPENKQHVKDFLACFIAPDGDYVMTKSDLSQAEIRFFVEVYKERELAIPINRGEDIHIKTAKACLAISDEEWNSYPPELADSKRQYGKGLNFALLYDAKPNTVVKYFADVFKIRITKEEAAIFSDRYFALYSGIRGAQEAQVKRALKMGYCDTPFGSVRRLNFGQPNTKQYTQARRYAINTPVQGTAGIFAYYLISVFTLRCRAAGLKTARIVNLIHDDTPGISHISEAATFAEIIEKTVKNPPLMQHFGWKFELLTMDTEFKWGKNWADLKKKASELPTDNKLTLDFL